MDDTTNEAMKATEGMPTHEAYWLIGWLCASSPDAVLDAIKGMREFDQAKALRDDRQP